MTRTNRSAGTRRWTARASLIGTLILAGCATTVITESGSSGTEQTATQIETPTTTSVPATTTSTTVPPATTDSPTTTTAPTTTTTTTPTTTSTTTTTTVPLDVFDASCVIITDTGSAMQQIGVDHSVDPVSLWLENDEIDVVAADTLVDICPSNGLNDVTGEPRPVPDGAALGAVMAANVERQQTKLNELFAGSGLAALGVDGISGQQTGQRLCAARLALGLDTTIGDMMPGSAEQAALFAAASLPTPDSTALGADRWVLIDRTCQVMFIGAGSETAFVFATSTGSAGYETRIQDRAAAFRFDPALDNGGWHDSSEFPVGVDNPLNGNLYKPLYFDLGQAIHGANNVPTTPQSKGCARLRVDDQNAFVAWLGLDTATGETWRKSEMNVTVNVQGEFLPRP